MGRFYRILQQLGVCVNDFDGTLRQTYTSEQARQHFLNIASEKHVVDMMTLDDMAQRTILMELDRHIEENEYHTAIKEMNESAGGDDEITMTMIRSVGEDMINEF